MAEFDPFCRVYRWKKTKTDCASPFLSALGSQSAVASIPAGHDLGWVCQPREFYPQSTVKDM